jgi:hypothetical protein
MKIAVFVTSFAVMVGINSEASADTDGKLAYFLNNYNGPNEAKFNLTCWQEGKELFRLRSLRIKQYSGKLAVGNRFFDTASPLGLIISPTTTCLVQPHSGN